MTGKRVLIHSLFMIALPIIVAYYGVSTGGAVALVIFGLLWRLAITLSGIMFPAKVPALELETIRISHFAEKVRWCMDRLGVEYVERPMIAIIGVFFQGRSVPKLNFRTGIVRSSIGNSPEILRYLWGRYSIERGDAASFLEPTAERLDMEQRIDRCGANLQVWVYYHILDQKDVTLHAWGHNDPSLPQWQRLLQPLLFPLFRAFIRKAFRISDEHYRNSVEHIEALLADVEERLSDGRHSILGGNEIDYVDISMAAISGLWLQPKGYGGGKSDDVLIGRGRYPIQMGVDVERWTEQYPNTVAFIERLYAEERLSG